MSIKHLCSVTRFLSEIGKSLENTLFASAIAGLLISAFISGSAHAEDFILGSEETSGITVASGGSDMNLRVRLQPRLDYGEIIKSENGNSYAYTHDLYLRRMRLEVTGHIMSKSVKYGLVISGDKADKLTATTTPPSESTLIHVAYIEWDANRAFNIMFGKEKLPYSRISLTSSAKRLMIENPDSTEDAKKLFGSNSEAYYQPKLDFFGSFLGGVASYHLAFADGWQNGESISTTPARSVFKSSPLYIARIELSPPGLVEDGRSDAHLGKGRHLTLGADFADQSSIKYSTDLSESRSLYGVDLSGHIEGFTGQLEFNRWRKKSTDPAVNAKTPWGWYAQAGYFISGPNIEPAVRYEVYNQDSRTNGSNQRNTTVGVNWYALGHSMKVQFNWVHTNFGANASNDPLLAATRPANSNRKEVTQLQAQLYF